MTVQRFQTMMFRSRDSRKDCREWRAFSFLLFMRCSFSFCSFFFILAFFLFDLRARPVLQTFLSELLLPIITQWPLRSAALLFLFIIIVIDGISFPVVYIPPIKLNQISIWAARPTGERNGCFWTSPLLIKSGPNTPDQTRYIHSAVCTEPGEPWRRGLTFNPGKESAIVIVRLRERESSRSFEREGLWPGERGISGRIIRLPYLSGKTLGWN